MACHYQCVTSLYSPIGSALVNDSLMGDGDEALLDLSAEQRRQLGSTLDSVPFGRRRVSIEMQNLPFPGCSLLSESPLKCWIRSEARGGRDQCLVLQENRPRHLERLRRTLFSRMISHAALCLVGMVAKWKQCRG